VLVGSALRGNRSAQLSRGRLLADIAIWARRAGYHDLPIGARLLIRMVLGVASVAMGAGAAYAFRASAALGVLAVILILVAEDYFFTWLAAHNGSATSRVDQRQRLSVADYQIMEVAIHLEPA
jgi:hypothetical protein